MASKLSDEIILLIFEEICLVAPRSFLSLCQVSRQFCRLASPLLYKSVPLSAKCLDLRNASGVAWYSFVANVLAHTRDVRVSESLKPEALVSLFSKMRRLESLRWSFWEEPFPSSVLHVLLQSWPDIKIYMEGFPIGHKTNSVQNTKTLEIIDSLSGCRNLHSMGAIYGQSRPMQAFKGLMLNSKQLRVLHIRLPEDDDGRFARGSSWIDRRDEPSGKLPPLVELVLEFPIFLNNERQLFSNSAWDWSQIRHLELSGKTMMGFVQSITGKFTTLSVLIVKDFCFMDDFLNATRILSDFISSLNGLSVLKLSNQTNQLPVSIICLHGKTLKNLSMRNLRRSIVPGTSSVYRWQYLPREIDLLQASCPGLVALDLNMAIVNEMPYDFLAALARFPNLESLRICFNFDQWAHNNYEPGPLPHIKTDRLIVRHIYEYLRLNKMGCRLTSLTLILGQYPRVLGHLGGPNYTVPINSFIRPLVNFTCREDEMRNIILDDDANEEESLVWDHYFDESRLEVTPGRTLPSNLMELIALGEEADWILAASESAMIERYGDMNNLFGSSP